MSTWSGWATDFLAAASLPNTADNRRFMNEWATNANHPGLTNNPIDLHVKEPGSTDGPTGPLQGQHFQNYHDAQNIAAHTWARTAFNSQIRASDFARLLAALRSGNPYKAANPGQVATNLGIWGSTTYANIYLAEAQAGPPGKPHAPQSFKGWRDLQRAINVEMPKTLKQAQTNRNRALRVLQNARKVGG